VTTCVQSVELPEAQKPVAPASRWLAIAAPGLISNFPFRAAGNGPKTLDQLKLGIGDAC